jgi:hypothetical protein
MTEVIPNYGELNRKIERQLQEARTKISNVVKSVFVDFLDKFPAVYGLGWTQYTPSWNDGEACEFEVHELNLYLTEEAYNNDDSDQDVYGRYRSKPSADELERIEGVGGEQEFRRILSHFAAVNAFFLKINPEDMKFVFGDGAKVLSTRSNFKNFYYGEL